MAKRKLTKEEIERLLTEAPIDYGDYPERMDPSIERRFRTRQHPLGDLPQYPSTEGPHHFEEIVVSERFKEVVDKIKRYAGMKNVQVVGRDGKLDAMKLIMIQLGLVRSLYQIESRHTTSLEGLAVKLVKDYFKIPDDVLQFDAKLEWVIDMGDIKSQAESDIEEDSGEEMIEDIEELDMEVAKRRFINALIHGSAFKGQYMFHMVEEQLDGINQNLIPLYGLFMAITEFAYFIIPPEQAQAAAGGESTSAGVSRIDLSTEPPTIIARAKTFPILLHEVIKGVMEYMSTHGLPKDPKKRKYVMDKSDFLEAENWDLMLGPNFWEKFVDAIGEEDHEIKAHLYAKIVEMPAQQFNFFMKEILKKSNKGKEMMVDLANEIKREIREEDYEDAMGQYGESPDDDDDSWEDVDISDLFD